MQGNVSMETVSQFMPVFFSELQRDGVIDRASSVARARSAGGPTGGRRCCSCASKAGGLWYAPGFGDRAGQHGEGWGLLTNIESGPLHTDHRPRAAETLVGDRRAIAQRWVETYHFPMAPYQRDDLAQVAQFLAVQQASCSPGRS